jgi:hypothetical protein
MPLWGKQRPGGVIVRTNLISWRKTHLGKITETVIARSVATKQTSECRDPLDCVVGTRLAMPVFLLSARAGKNKNIKKTTEKAGTIAAGTFPYLRPQGMSYVCSDIHLFILKITFMSISYTLVKRKNLSPEAAPDEKLYYAQTQATRTYSFDEICEDATDTSTLSSGDLKLATDRIVLLMVKSLRKGEVVHLGELGNFQLMVIATFIS